MKGATIFCAYTNAIEQNVEYSNGNYGFLIKGLIHTGSQIDSACKNASFPEHTFVTYIVLHEHEYSLNINCYLIKGNQVTIGIIIT